MTLKKEGLRPSGLRNFSIVNPIPDREDLQMWYDWSKENGGLPVTDQSGNENNLDLGGYSGVSTSINGLQAGDFAGGGTNSEDWVGGDNLSTVDPPYHDFIVLEPRNVSNTQYLFSLIGNSHPSVRSVDSADTWAVRPNSSDANISGSGVDTPILLEVLWESSSTTIYNVNSGGSQSVSEGAGQSTSLRIGVRDGLSFYLNAKIGEHIRYNTSKETIRSNVHDYFSQKWDIQF
jgi:hypothetical protein